MNERELLLDCLKRLNQSGIPYMLTGSMASNYWGIPRTTHDLDFVVQVLPASVPSLMTAFAGDFFLQEASVRAAFQPPHQFNAIDTRSALKVDFWLLRDQPFEQSMFGRRSRVELYQVPAWIAVAEDVVLHKLYWNRLTPSERQLSDAAGVVVVQGEALNRSYLRQWAADLGVSNTMEDLIAGRIKPKAT